MTDIRAPLHLVDLHLPNAVPRLTRVALEDFWREFRKHPETVDPLNPKACFDAFRRVCRSKEVRTAATRFEAILTQRLSPEAAGELVKDLIFQAFYNKSEFNMRDLRPPIQVIGQMRQVIHALSVADDAINTLLEPVLYQPDKPAHPSRMGTSVDELRSEAATLRLYRPDGEGGTSKPHRETVGLDLPSLLKLHAAFVAALDAYCDDASAGLRRGKGLTHPSYAVKELSAVFQRHGALFSDVPFSAAKNSMILVLVNVVLDLNANNALDLAKLRNLLNKENRRS